MARMTAVTGIRVGDQILLLNGATVVGQHMEAANALLKRLRGPITCVIERRSRPAGLFSSTVHDVTATRTADGFGFLANLRRRPGTAPRLVIEDIRPGCGSDGDLMVDDEIIGIRESLGRSECVC